MEGVYTPPVTKNPQVGGYDYYIGNRKVTNEDTIAKAVYEGQEVIAVPTGQKPKKSEE